MARRRTAALAAALLGACGGTGREPTAPVEPVRLSAPSDVRTQVEGATRVRVSWTDTDAGVALFRIERRLARGCAENYVVADPDAPWPPCALPDTTWREVATAGAADRTWLDAAALPDRDHRYRVVACDAAGAAAACETSTVAEATTFAAVSGTVTTADGGPLPDLTLTLRAADGETASGTIPPGGAFHIELPFSAPGWSEIEVATSDPVGAAYFPALFRLEALEMADTLRLLLVPRAWTVRRGAYEGDTVPISLDDAFDSRVAVGSFYQVGSLAERYGAFLYAWSAAFPLPVRFDRAQANRPIEAADSAAWWAAVDSLERVMGRDLFRPAAAVTGTPSVRVWVDATLSFSGLGAPFTSVPPGRRIQDVAGWHDNAAPVAELDVQRVDSAEVVLASRGLLGNVGLVEHELIHVLGIGHGCKWASIMVDCAGSNHATKTQVPTASDVAYIELMWAILAHRDEDDANTETSVLAALAGERTLLRHERPFHDPLPACWPGC